MTGKKSMLGTILIVVAALIVVLLVVIALQSAEYRIERKALISASTDVVFAQVNDFHKWDAWSPWAKLDPGIKQTYEGSPAGEGSVYSWSGNKKVGEGRMTLTDSRPNELVRIRLEFLKPFASTAMTEFTFKPEGNQTAVTWSMSGKNGFMAKAFSLFMNCDKMVGDQFEKGFANLQKAVASSAKN